MKPTVGRSQWLVAKHGGRSGSPHERNFLTTDNWPLTTMNYEL